MCRLLGPQDIRQNPAGPGVEGELLEVTVLDHVLNKELDRVLVAIFRDDLRQETEILVRDFLEIVKCSQILCHFLPIIQGQVRKTSKGDMSATATFKKRVKNNLVFDAFR